MNLSSEKKIAGILVPLFALRGANDLGVGDLGALREFIDWSADAGFHLVQLLPINETGGDNSPYNAISSMAIEPTTLLLAPGSPEDLTESDFAEVTNAIRPDRLRHGPVKYRASQKTETNASRKSLRRISGRRHRRCGASSSQRSNPLRRGGSRTTHCFES